MKTPFKTAALLATGAAMLIGGTAAAGYITVPVRPGGELAPSRLTASAAGKLIVGAQSQTTWLSPLDFHPVGDPRECALTPNSSASGYADKFLFRAVGPCQKYIARVPLPEGASINTVTAYGLDNDPVAQMAVGLDHPMVTRTGAVINWTELGPSSSSNSTTAMVPDSFGWRPKTLIDFEHTYLVNNTGVVKTYPTIVLLIPASDKLSILDVEIGWSRAYGVDVATPTFSDVPAAHPYFFEVESFAKAGVSTGCGGGRFCVDAPVTRGQMAVFLSRAMGLYDETANDPPAQ